MPSKLSTFLRSLLIWLASTLGELRSMRHALLSLSILFFTIMLLEVDLGHRSALAAQDAWLALVPVVWLPVSLLALIAVQCMPSTFTAIFAQIVMAIAAAVGMIGSGLHMMVSGVNLENLGRMFSSAVWGGPASPNWPVAITVAAVLGLVASFGANHEDETTPRDIGATAGVAYVLIIVAIGLNAMPSAVMVSASCLALAALLLLATLIAMLATAREKRSTT
jgi:hypothetical protein